MYRSEILVWGAIEEEYANLGILRLGGNAPIVDNESCYFFCMIQKTLSAVSILCQHQSVRLGYPLVLDLEDVGKGQREEVSLPSMAVDCEEI